MTSVRKLGGRVAGAAVAAVLMSACGFTSSTPPAANSTSPPAGKSHAHHHRTRAHRVAAYRVVGVSASSITLKRGHHAAVTVPSSVPLYFEGARVSAAGWLHTGERVRAVGTTSAPGLLVLLPTATGTIQQASASTLVVTTAKHKSLTVSLPSTYPSGDTVDVGQPLAAGAHVAIIASRSHPAGLLGLAGVPTLVHGTLVSKSGSTIIAAVGGKNTASLPFLGSPQGLAHLAAGQPVTVLESPGGAPLAAQ